MNKIIPGKSVSFYEILFGLCLLGGAGFFVKGIFENHRERQAFSEQQGGGDGSTLIQTLNQTPFDLRARMNLAFHYGVRGEWLKSLKEYQVAWRVFSRARETFVKGDSENSLPSRRQRDMLFYLTFNSAVAASALSDTQGALKFYQQALVFRPRSREVKTNIELLMKNKDSQQKSPSDSESPLNRKQNPRETGSDSKDSRQKKPSADSNKLEESSKEKPTPDSPLKDQKVGSKGQKPDSSPSLNAGQVEAVLKAIEEQEKQIRKKRQQETGSYRESGPKKDW